MSSFDHAYFVRHAALEREAARRASDPKTRLMHEDAARVYDALAAKAAAAPAYEQDVAADICSRLSSGQTRSGLDR